MSSDSLENDFCVVIPARYESSRFPGKLLEDICGKSLIQRVVECAQTSATGRVVVATDSDLIEQEVADQTDAEVCRTSTRHSTGTDRIAEAVRHLDFPDSQIVVNVQGDEPLMSGKLIDQVAFKLANNRTASLVTAACSVKSQEELTDPNVVKCWVNANGWAVTFSRAPDLSEEIAADIAMQRYAHIGIYAYRVGYLQKFVNYTATRLEVKERLEQMRAIENRDSIMVHITDNYRGIGVDTREDLERVRNLLITSEHHTTGYRHEAKI